MPYLPIGLAGLAVLVALWALLTAHQASKVDSPAQVPAYDDADVRSALASMLEAQRTIQAHYADLDRWQADITMAVGEGIAHVDRVENRVRATVRRAQEKLAEHGYEHPALEAEANELREVDGDGSDQGELPAVPEVVAPAGNAYAGIPGEINDGNFVRLA